MQHANDDDDMQPVLHDNEIKHIQKAVRITSYHATALNNSALMAINDLATSQSLAKNPRKMPLRNFLTTSQHIQTPKSYTMKALWCCKHTSMPLIYQHQNQEVEPRDSFS